MRKPKAQTSSYERSDMVELLAKRRRRFCNSTFPAGVQSAPAAGLTLRTTSDHLHRRRTDSSAATALSERV
jgi:hypothetical protein